MVVKPLTYLLRVNSYDRKTKYEKLSFWPFMTSRGQIVYLRSNLRTQSEKICKWAIESFFRALLALIVHEPGRHLSDIVGLNRITVKFDL